jgi:alkanesulfonate monooxygenase SsuD/methylene tetrahydromethanopterin reductase-like flavin-dependent oxidoreductase (luciferase family)
MRIALMIEGQEDVTWDDWVALADACERSGIEALFRSDHYLSVMGEGGRGSLDAWGTINALAARTSSLQLGTLVSPAGFRHPSVLAKLAVTADHVSGGRVSLGLGTGWSEVEHTAYGFPFLSMKERMDVLEEQLQIVRGHWAPGPFSFHGSYYSLENLDALPKPVGELPLIMGGGAGPRAARLAAAYADEYNTVMPTVEQVRERRAAIVAACEKAGREPIPFSAMTPSPQGADRASIAETVERLRAFASAGASRAFLQHLRHRDLATVEAIGTELVPAVA